MSVSCLGRISLVIHDKDDDEACFLIPFCRYDQQRCGLVVMTAAGFNEVPDCSSFFIIYRFS